MTALVECRGLVAGHGKVVVLRSLDLDVDAGEVLAVLGPNGAGKSTLLETLAGLLPRLGGEVEIAGARVPSGRPNAASRAGLVLVPDDRSLFTRLSVAENLEVGAKTGTAQLGTGRSHAWLIAFAGPPGGQAQVAVAVIVEGQEGASEQTGGRVAAPIAKAVMQAVLTAPPAAPSPDGTGGN